MGAETDVSEDVTLIIRYATRTLAMKPFEVDDGGIVDG
jgi:hypothetical protein